MFGRHNKNCTTALNCHSSSTWLVGQIAVVPDFGISPKQFRLPSSGICAMVRIRKPISVNESNWEFKILINGLLLLISCHPVNCDATKTEGVGT